MTFSFGALSTSESTHGCPWKELTRGSRLLAEFDDDDDGVITLQEFAKLVTQQDLESKMTIAF